MKVLFGYLTAEYRGGTKFQLDFAGNFRNSQVGFITSNPRVKYEEDVEKIGTIHRLPPTKQFFRRLAALRKLAEEYDVLYLNKAVLNPFELYLAKHAGFKKVVFHSHATGKDTKNPIVKAGYHILHRLSRPFVTSVADKLCACSQDAARWLFGPSRLTQTDLIYNGVDVERYRFDPVRREEMRGKLDIGGFCVLHVGAFSTVKNQGYLVRAFSAFHRNHPDSVLLLVGQGELLDAVKQEADATGLGDAIQFLGQRNDVADIMQAADLLVLPSLHEGLPFVAVEAQAAGLPCILTDTASAEAGILDTCSFFDISQPAEALAEEMEKKVGLPRKDTSDDLRAAGFDLKTCARKLESDLAKML